MTIPAIAAMTFAIGAAVYAYGIVFEHEYPYWYLLHRVRSARAPHGQSITSILEEHLGRSAASVHWHTDSYCSYLAHDRSLTYVQFRYDRQVYEFAYHANRGEIVPMSIATADAFPELMPPGDNLVPVVPGETTVLNGGEVLIPLSWRNGAPNSSLQPRTVRDSH